MDLRSIYITNGVGIFILLLLLYTSRTKIQRRRTEDRIYTAMVFGVMAGCAMEALSYSIDGQIFPGARILNYLSNTYLYCANLLLPFCLCMFVDLGLYEDPSRIWKNYKPQIIIGSIMIALNVVNYFVPIVYWVSEQNVYERRPLSYAYFVVIFYFCISAFVTSHRFEKENGARTFFSIGVFLTPILIGTALQFMFYGLSLAWLAAAIGLTGLFMMQQNELAYIDSLTDVYNRRYLNFMLSSWIDKELTFIGAMIDIDRFKNINDSFGHTEGDRALKTVATILMKSRLGGERVFRFAGDEFIVLKRAESPDELSAYVERVSKNLEEHNESARLYELSLSYGMSFFQSGNIDTFMKDIDGKMYEMKEQHHRKSGL